MTNIRAAMEEMGYVPVTSAPICQNCAYSAGGRAGLECTKGPFRVVRTGTCAHHSPFRLAAPEVKPC